MFGCKCVCGLNSGRSLCSQIVDRQPDGDDSNPTGQAAPLIPPKLAQFFPIVPEDGNEELLIEIFNLIGSGLGVVEKEGLFNCMVDKGEYCRTKASQAAFSPLTQPASKVFSFSVIKSYTFNPPPYLVMG